MTDTDEALTTRAREVVKQVRDFMAGMGHVFSDEEAVTLVAAFGRECREAAATEWMQPALVQHVRELGCKCEKPLLGYSPGYGPRCRLCNVDAEDQQKQEKARAAALQQQLEEARAKQRIDEAQCDDMTDLAGRLAVERDQLQSQLSTAHARVREMEEQAAAHTREWDIIREALRKATERADQRWVQIGNQHKRITQLEGALKGLRTMVVNVLTDSQLDHVNCGQTIRNALGPVDALLSPDDGSQP
jgi:lipid II:glycine glycyltransferase (peptidoglycan interpeptide bridge formation enzyme)